MKKTKPTLTIGIPAHNEADNIADLLNDILKQDISLSKLEKVLIYSDGSDDATVQKSKKMKMKLLQVIEGKIREGKATAINKIVTSTESDILVVFDADTRIFDKKFIDKLTHPIVEKKADLTSARVEEFTPQNFIQKILTFSMQMKKEVFEKYKNGNNLFTCHGRSRGFSKKMYKAFNLKVSASEDANSYLTCITKNMKYQYISNAHIYYELPKTLSDHKKQSIRFLQYKNHLDDKFGQKIVREAYYIPIHLWITTLVKYLIIQPFYIFVYFIFLSALKFESFFSKENIQTWGISKSSKKH